MYRSGYLIADDGVWCEHVGRRVPVEWRTSSYSTGDGGQCVEVANIWRKSSYSDANGGQCVEAGGSGVIHA
jgi:hypothetical protein